MTNRIVTVNESQTVAPTPNALQRTGAFVSQGGTTNAAQTLTYITQVSDLTSILSTPKTISSLAWATGTVTVTATAAHNLTVGQQYNVTISGAAPTAYNGTYVVTPTTTTAFTYSLTTNPGTATSMGTWTPASTTELTQMATTFFANGSSIGIYVLELGVDTVTNSVAALSTFLSNNPQTIYVFLIPRAWDANAAFLALALANNGMSAEVYFWVTTTNLTYSQYGNTRKSVFAMIESPNAAATEFSLAAALYHALNTNPSSTNRVAPLAFRYLYGVTAYPTSGNGTKMAAWKAAGINWVQTGSEGGITNTCLYWGTYTDGRPWNYWYSVDWSQINVDLNVSNAVINGSNNQINPLALNPDGIARLQAVAAATMSSAVTFGLALGRVIQTSLNQVDFAAALDANAFAGSVVINAVPFTDYYRANQGDYKIGVYNGFSVTYTPLRGFDSITFNVDVTDFVA